jgi:hypothetical protein
MFLRNFAHIISDEIIFGLETTIKRDALV